MTRPTHRHAQRGRSHKANDAAAFCLPSFEDLECKLLMSTYYMATNGSDTGAGTMAAPFATLKKFFSIAHAGDTLYLRGGTYDASTWRSTSPKVSGTASAPITVSNMPGEQVTINDSSANNDSFINLSNGESYLVFQGLSIRGYMIGFNMEGGTPNHITLQNLDIANTASTSDGRGIRMRGTDNITIENVNLHDIGGIGIAGIGHNTNITIDDAQIYNIDDHRPWATDADGINFTYGDNSYSDNVTISNTKVWNVASDGIDIKADHVTETNDVAGNLGGVAFKAWSIVDGTTNDHQTHFTFNNCVGFNGVVGTFKALNLPVVSMKNCAFYGTGSASNAAVFYKAPDGGETWKGSLDIQNTIMEHTGGNDALWANQNGDTHFYLNGNTYYSSGAKDTAIGTSSGTKEFTAAQMMDGTFKTSIGTESSPSVSEAAVPAQVTDVPAGTVATSPVTPPPVTPPPVTPPPVTPPPVTPPPAGTTTFTGADIGSPTPAGSTVYDASTGTYSITGGGANIWGNADQFQYAAQTMSGDGTIIARVDSMTDPHQFAKAGLMFRASMDPGAPEVMVTLTGSNGTGLYYRTAAGGTSANILAGDTTQAAPVWLKLVRSGSTFTGYKSSDGSSWVKIGTVTVSMPQTIYAGMAVNSHNTTTACAAKFDHVALSGSAAATPVTPAITVNLTGVDIGSPAIAGKTVYASSTGTYAVSGAGANIWDSADQFQYAYQTMNGDGTIVARIDAFSYTHQFAKAGLMIRNSTDPGAAQVMMALTGSNGTGLYYRTANGGTSANILAGDTTVRAPMWVKLVRSGNIFTGYKSSDGITWTQVGQVTVAMGSTVDVGLAVGSHDASNLATAQFDNVKIS